LSGVKNAEEEAIGRGYRGTDRTVCPSHVGDSVLKAAIQDNLSEPTCSYCDVSGSATEPVAAPLDALLEPFMVGVRSLYEPYEGPVTPSVSDWLMMGDADVTDVVQEVFELATIGGDQPPYELKCDVADALVVDHWARREWQRLSPSEALWYSWESFKELVKHETRFFFMTTLEDPDGDERLNPARFFPELVNVLASNPAIFPVSCPSPLFRGRMFPTKRTPAEMEQLGTAEQLGSPPESRASANRMSPAGISMFYGATDLETAIAEIGAHSPDAYAVTGQFVPMRDIRLVDLTHLPKLPSIFDPTQRLAYHVAKFLSQFVEDLGQSIVLDGREHIEYVPTQVFTEYLRLSFPGRVDGLMFKSTQGPGSNVVVFCGPKFCADKGSEGEFTRLSLDPATVEMHSVTTVNKPPWWRLLGTCAMSLVRRALAPRV